mmetsp:Transcript_18815/g.71667  ORF Transcript_18815/g.71667 Transcript_18815/m.71667 type:complete len:201 (+) Transcript_18815:4439-5041(+)
MHPGGNLAAVTPIAAASSASSFSRAFWASSARLLAAWRRAPLEAPAAGDAGEEVAVGRLCRSPPDRGELDREGASTSGSSAGDPGIMLSRAREAARDRLRWLEVPTLATPAVLERGRPIPPRMLMARERDPLRRGESVGGRGTGLRPPTSSVMSSSSSSSSSPPAADAPSFWSSSSPPQLSASAPASPDSTAPASAVSAS